MYYTVNHMSGTAIHILFTLRMRIEYELGFTLAIFRMLTFDDFISYSSYTTTIYMKNKAGSARSSVVEKFAFLDSMASPLGVIFSMVEMFYNFVFFMMRTPYGLRIYCRLAKIRQMFSTSEVLS